MKCTYKFKVHGQVRVAELKSVQVRGFEFRFIVADELITHLIVTVPANQADDIPLVIESPGSGVKANIKIPAPCFLFVQKEVRAIEVLLSVFGLHSIDLNNFETEWISENDEEKNKLKISHFETYRGVMKTNEIPFLPFEILARSIITAADAADVEVSLSFFRKGSIDMSEERYIEAFYDYYFFLESFFGEGKTKNHAVQEAFKKSEPLKVCIDNILRGPDSKLMARNNQNARFREKFKTKTTDEIIDHIVNLRGYLHHHSAKRKDGWHPEDHGRFELDALLLHNIAYRIAMDTVIPCIYQEKTTAKYQGMYEQK
jgi:hypothetical protein